MPGNPRECRQHALNCQKLAERARNTDDSGECCNGRWELNDHRFRTCIEPDRVADDFWREAVALKRYWSHPTKLIGDQPQRYPSYRDIA